MKKLLEKTITNRIKRYIEGNKYLRDAKYYKNNYWSWAAWDSWAAQGQAGGCGICNNKYHNASLRNKRACTRKGGDCYKYTVDVSVNICSSCVTKIHKILGVNFDKK